MANRKTHPRTGGTLANDVEPSYAVLNSDGSPRPKAKDEAQEIAEALQKKGLDYKAGAPVETTEERVRREAVEADKKKAARGAWFKAFLSQHPKLRLIYNWLIAKLWPLIKAWGHVLCVTNHHDWEDTYALDDKGEPVPGKLGSYKRCKRGHCRIYRGQIKLLSIGKWIETDDFMTLAQDTCPQCHGRGYRQRMILPGGARAKVPCGCVRVQPRFIDAPAEKAK